MTKPDAHLLTLVNLLEGNIPAADGVFVRERLASDMLMLEHWRSLSQAIEEPTPPEDIDDVDDFDLETIAAFVDGQLEATDAVEFERDCWRNPAALREVVSAVRCIHTAPAQNDVPAEFSKWMAQFIATECMPAQPSRQENGQPEELHNSPATIRRKRPRVPRSITKRTVLTTLSAVAIMSAVGLVAYFVVRDRAGADPEPITDNRDEKSGANFQSSQRKSTDSEDRPAPTIVLSPKTTPDGVRPKIVDHPPQTKTPKPDSGTRDGPPVQIAWTDVSGIVAWRKVDTDRWSGIRFSEKNGTIAGPMTIRTLQRGWIRANFKSGPQYVLDESSEVRMTARRSASAALNQTVIWLEHRHGKVAFSQFRAGDRIRVKYGDHASTLRIDAHDTAVGFIRSESAPMVEIIVWSGSVQLGERRVVAGESIRISGQRIGKSQKIGARHQWRRIASKKLVFRKSIVDRLNRSSDLLVALAVVDRKSPVKDITLAARFAFSLDPVVAVPAATSSRIEAERIAAIHWLLAANESTPTTIQVWNRVERMLGPSATRHSVRKWFEASQGEVRPNPMLLRGLSIGLGAQQPIFMRQAAIYFCRRFTQLPLKEYKPDRPTKSAINSVLTKLRRAYNRDRQRKLNPKRNR